MADTNRAFHELLSQFELELAINTLKFLVEDGKVSMEDVQSALKRAATELKKPSVTPCCTKCAGLMEPHGQCSECGEYPSGPAVVVC